MPAIPAVIGAAVGIGGAIITSHAQNKAVDKAVDAQTQSSDQQMALLKQIYAQNSQNEQPYLNSGYGALAVQEQLLGLKPMTAEQFNNGQWYQPGTVQYGQPATQPNTGSTGTPATGGTQTPSTPAQPVSGYTGPSWQQIMGMQNTNKKAGQAAMDNFLAYYQSHPNEDPGFTDTRWTVGDQYKDESKAGAVLNARNSYLSAHPTPVNGSVSGVGATGFPATPAGATTATNFAATPAGGASVATSTPTANNPITIAQHAQQAIAAGADPSAISARLAQMGVQLN